MPEVGRDMQSFEPPPQLATPELPIREAPIINITVPVTRGGKMRLRAFGEQNDMKISRKEQIRDVPEVQYISWIQVSPSQMVLTEDLSIGIGTGKPGHRAVSARRRSTRSVPVHCIEDLQHHATLN